MRAPRAAVDVGTNSVRLLVVDADGRPLARDMTITRLGVGVDATGRLDDDALDRTIEVLATYRRRWTELGADRVRIAATSAVRDAADRERFFTRVRDTTGGVEAEVLSGDEEAAIAYRGATAKLDVARPAVLLDVGGGSTEIAVGDGDDGLVGAVSLQLGCVRLTERLLPSDPPTPRQLQAACDEIAVQLDRAAAQLSADPARCATLIGVAGTVTTLAALHLDLDRYDPDRIHGTRLPRDAVTELVGWLAALPAAARAELRPMAPGREDIIVAGGLIVGAVLERWGFAEIVASEADILDGLTIA